MYKKIALLIIFKISLLFFSGCQSINLEIKPPLSNNYHRHQLDTDTIVIRDEVFTVYNPYHEKCLLSLKGSMHNHTDNSAPIDTYGSGDPFLTAQKFRDKGYFDFYCFTDHNFVTSDKDVEDIIWMGKALEDTQPQHHLIVYNLPDNYEYQFISKDINEQIKYYHSIGAYVSYAHPDWSGSYQPTEKITSVEDVDFVEVFNTIEGGSERAYNSLLLKKSVMAFGTDDYHYNSHWDNPEKYFNKSYIIVNTNKREREAIWSAILKGNFYASTGAKMDITLEGAYLIIKCNEESDILINTPDIYDVGQSIVLQKYNAQREVKYKFTGTEGVIWIKIENSTGSAISQPIFITKKQYE